MRRRRELFLELTPLLDVILIMMFYILMQNTQASGEKQEEADRQVAAMQEQMEAVNESASAAAESYEDKLTDIQESLTYINDQLGSFEEFEKYSQIVTISVINEGGGERTVYITDGENEESVTYGWDNMLYARNGLKDGLEQVLKKKEEGSPSFLVFHYQDDVIYRQDFQMITEVLGETTQGRTDVYIRQSNEE